MLPNAENVTLLRHLTQLRYLFLAAPLFTMSLAVAADNDGSPPGEGPPPLRDPAMMDARLKKDQPEIFAQADADHDSVLSEAERKTARELMRAQAVKDALAAGDADGDGKLSRAEFTVALTALAAKHRAPPPCDEAGERPEPPPPPPHDEAGERPEPPPHGERPKPPSAAEREKSADAAFAKADTNGDGTLNATELATALDQMHRHRPKSGASHAEN